MALRCVDCGESVNPRDAGTLVEVRGFAKHREGGGQNHVLFREETGRFLCSTCAVRRKYGGSAKQESLFA